MRRVSIATHDKLVAVTAERYARVTRRERSVILDEFAGVTGFHRKHATRLLQAGLSSRLVSDQGVGSTTTRYARR